MLTQIPLFTTKVGPRDGTISTIADPTLSSTASPVDMHTNFPAKIASGVSKLMTFDEEEYYIMHAVYKDIPNWHFHTWIVASFFRSFVLFVSLWKNKFMMVVPFGYICFPSFSSSKVGRSRFPWLGFGSIHHFSCNAIRIWRICMHVVCMEHAMKERESHICITSMWGSFRTRVAEAWWGIHII